VRELTSAEYRTILAILGHPSATETERIRSSQLPSSTYNVVRRRVFDAGWLADVMVPNPGACGFGAVELSLARPALSHRDELVRSWSSDAECVLLWTGLHAVLGIFFRARAPDRSSETATRDGTFRVVARRSGGSVPVYFDYSGLWARFGGEPPRPGYPAGLDAAAATADHRALAAATTLFRPGRTADAGAPRWTSMFRLTRSPRRALEEGLAQTRTVLRPWALPPYDGRRVGELLLIEGRLRAGTTATRLLGWLTGECAVFPFLLAEGDGRVLIAGLGQTSATALGRVPVPSARRPVMSALTDHLDPVDLLIEPVESVQEQVGHRYPGRLPGLGPPVGRQVAVAGPPA
jgi:hypothetical protein